MGDYMSLYSFDSDVANDVGVNAAVIYQNIIFWWKKNKANNKHWHDGRYWTYNSVKAFSELFPFLTAKQIRTAIIRLEDGGYLVTGEYNTKKYDRTKWYSPLKTPQQTLCPVGQMDMPQKANGYAQEGEPIPDSKPDSKHISKELMASNDAKPKKKRRSQLPDDFKLTDDLINKALIHWSRNGHTEDVHECFESFCDHHRAKGSVMANWDSAWGTWYRNSVKFNKGKNNGKQKTFAEANRLTENWVEQRRAERDEIDDILDGFSYNTPV